MFNNWFIYVCGVNQAQMCALQNLNLILSRQHFCIETSDQNQNVSTVIDLKSSKAD